MAATAKDIAAMLSRPPRLDVPNKARVIDPDQRIPCPHEGCDFVATPHGESCAEGVLNGHRASKHFWIPGR